MIFEVIVKPSHPTGTYNRAGLSFAKTAPTKLEDPAPKLLKTLQADPWLIVSEGKPEETKPPQKAGPAKSAGAPAGTPPPSLSGAADGSAAGNQGGGAGAAS